jgi:hypothetical protein
LYCTFKMCHIMPDPVSESLLIHHGGSLK